MGKAWLVMRTLEKHVQSLGDSLFSLPLKLASSVESQFQRRWRDMMKTDLHYVGALFNPYFLGNNMIRDNVNAKEGIKWVLYGRCWLMQHHMCKF
jgi:hypothetical protein